MSTCQSVSVFVSCLNDYCSMFHVKNKCLKILSAGYPALDSISGCTAEASLSYTPHLARYLAAEGSPAGKLLLRKSQQLNS